MLLEKFKKLLQKTALTVLNGLAILKIVTTRPIKVCDS